MSCRSTTGIALLRGINVGGKGRLAMKDLVSLLEGLGLESVRTYVQSGNAVFRDPRGADPESLAERIGAEVQRRHGFEPAVLVLDIRRLEKAVAGNPFPEAVDEPKSLHANFLAAEPDAPDLAGLERLKSHSERFALRGRVLYVHAPDGIARSKLVAGAEKRLGVPMTGRNWRSVTKILELAHVVDGEL